MRPLGVVEPPGAKQTLFIVFAGVVLPLLCAGLLAVRADVAIGRWLSTLQGSAAATLTHTPKPGKAGTLSTEGSTWPTSVPELIFTPLTPQQAEALNDSVPFSKLPIEPARPFVVPALASVTGAQATQCLTQAIYYEAGLEPVEGQEAVAQVVINRVRHPMFPKTICGVIYQGSTLPTGCQFTFTCDGSLATTPEPAVWSRAQKVAERALSGFVMPKVGTATHYHARYVAPYWLGSLVKLTQIGAHIFYRWPGAAGQISAFNGIYAGDEVGPALAPALALAAAPPTHVVATPLVSALSVASPAPEQIIRPQTPVVVLDHAAVVSPMTANVEQSPTSSAVAAREQERQVPAIVRGAAPCLNPARGCRGW